MKWLVHSDEAQFDEASLTWSFDLDTRIHNPRRIVLRHAAFTLRSDESPKPHVVYMRSRALTNMATNKHTVELKAANHHAASDVLAVLHETHTRGRYAMERPVTLTVDPSHSKRGLDFYFTDGQTRLKGKFAGAAEQAANSAPTRADVEALIGGFALFNSMEGENCRNTAYENVTVLGDPVRYMYQHLSAEQTMVFTGYQDFTLANFGNSKCLVSDASWNYAIDSTAPNEFGTPSFPRALVMCFKAPSDLTSTYKLFHFDKERVNLIAPGVLEIFQQNSWFTAGALVPNRDYMLSILLIRDGNDFIKTVWLENLTESPGTVTQIGQNIAGGTATQVSSWSFSDPSQHFLGQTGGVGPHAAWGGATTEQVTIIQNYFRGLYTTAVEEEVASGEDARWFAELRVEQGQ